jgi:hypothetical protein
MRQDLARIVGLLLAAMLVTAACGDPSEAARSSEPGLTGGWATAGCEFRREPLTTTVGGFTVPATPPALDAAMARIDRGGRADHPDSYAGLEVDQQQVRAIVYRVPSAEFDHFVRLSAEDSCVVVRDAAHGLTELTAWHDRIVADLPRWADRGVRINTVGARHDGVGVEVGTQDVSRTRDALVAAYGPEAPLVFVEEGPVRPLAAPPASPAVPKAPQQGG